MNGDEVSSDATPPIVVGSDGVPREAIRGHELDLNALIGSLIGLTPHNNLKLLLIREVFGFQRVGT